MILVILALKEHFGSKIPPINGWCVMPLSTRRIVRGGAIGPLPGKTHKHLSDRSKNCAVFRGRQFVEKSAISSQSINFCGRYEFLKFWSNAV